MAMHGTVPECVRALQIEKLRARNARKKDRKMQKKKAEAQSNHVWGEHKLAGKKSTVGKTKSGQKTGAKSPGDSEQGKRKSVDSEKGGISKSNKARTEELVEARLQKKMKKQTVD